MRTLLSPFFYIPLLIAGVIYTLSRLGIILPCIIAFYVNDFLCMPIVLTLCLAVIRELYQRPDYKLSQQMIWVMVIFYSILFEWILPNFNPRYTADFIDVILYFLGGFSFLHIQKYLPVA